MLRFVTPIIRPCTCLPKSQPAAPPAKKPVKDAAQIWNVGHFDVLHHLRKIMTASYKYVHLREFVLNQLQFPDILLTEGRVSIEMRHIEERHYLVQLAAWMMMNPAVRLSAAWKAGAVRYNVLRKGFERCQGWYDAIVEAFSDWRSGLGRS